MTDLGRALITAGAVILFLGIAVTLFGRFFPQAGNLPGDLKYEGENVKIYAPFMTMIIVSIVLTIILNVINRFFR